VVVARHRGGGCPREVIVQRSSEALVAIKSGILQSLIETCDRSLVHLLVRPVAAVNPHYGRLITILLGIRSWPTECFCPVRSQALCVLWMKSVAECMANDFILQHSRVPRMRQSQEPIETARSFINGLHFSREDRTQRRKDATAFPTAFITSTPRAIIVKLLKFKGRGA
jgi:hypothetical protein